MPSFFAYQLHVGIANKAYPIPFSFSHMASSTSWYCTFKYAQNWLIRHIVASGIMLAVFTRKSCKCNTIWLINLQLGSLLAIFSDFRGIFLHETARRNKKDVVQFLYHIVQFLYQMKFNLKDYKFVVFLCYGLLICFSLAPTSASYPVSDPGFYLWQSGRRRRGALRQLCGPVGKF